MNATACPASSPTDPASGGSGITAPTTCERQSVDIPELTSTSFEAPVFCQAGVQPVVASVSGARVRQSVGRAYCVAGPGEQPVACGDGDYGKDGRRDDRTNGRTASVAND